MKHRVPRVYEGRRNEAGAVVTVRTAASSRTWDLPARLDLANHSPTGFEWGYCGSGPAQLALALLADATRSDQKATALYQLFKAEFIAVLPYEGWTLTQEEIRAWAEGKDLADVMDSRRAERARR